MFLTFKGLTAPQSNQSPAAQLLHQEHTSRVSDVRDSGGGTEVAEYASALWLINHQRGPQNLQQNNEKN